MERILKAIEEKRNAGYGNNQLEVVCGCPNSLDVDEDGYAKEGYFIAKLNSWGSTPITDVLVPEGEIKDSKLIEELDKLEIAYCL